MTMNNCLRCGENKATVCTSCVNEIQETSEEWSAVVWTLNELYENWAKYGREDLSTQDSLMKLMRFYDKWLG